MKDLEVNEIKKIQLNILKSVDDYCSKNDIKYFLSYGTLLGAIRHKGYIPWDDDIDIMMLRNDYEQFLSDFNKNRTDNLEVLHSSIDKKFPYEFAKIHDKTTTLIENVDVKYSIGVNIDLFVVDYLGDNKENAKKIYNKNWIWEKILLVKNIKSNKKDRNFIKNNIVKLLKFICKPITIYKITSSMNKNSQKYKNANGKYLGILCERDFTYAKVFEKEWFNDSIKVQFENLKLNIPKQYDKILKTMYGNYMQFPPKEERITHHDYIAYQK